MGRRRRYDRIEPYRPPERAEDSAAPAAPRSAARSHARHPNGSTGGSANSGVDGGTDGNADAPTDDPDAVVPVDVDGVLATTVGTVLWALAFLVLLPFRGTLEDDDAEWWLWTCMAGVGLGLFGIAYCRRRRDRMTAGARRART